MINIFLKTAPEIDKELAERLAGIRKRRKMNKKEMNERVVSHFTSLKSTEKKSRSLKE